MCICALMLQIFKTGVPTMEADSSGHVPADAPAITAPTALAAPTTAQPPSTDLQGPLAAKTEPKPETPVVVDKAILGPDSFAEKFSDGTICVIWIMAWLCVQLSYNDLADVSPQRIQQFLGSPPSSLPTEDLPVETFTLSLEIDILQKLESSDQVRQTFTMEAFTLWSHQDMAHSHFMEPPCPQGEKHLPMETFYVRFSIFGMLLHYGSSCGLKCPVYIQCV